MSWCVFCWPGALTPTSPLPPAMESHSPTASEDTVPSPSLLHTVTGRWRCMTPGGWTQTHSRSFVFMLENSLFWFLIKMWESFIITIFAPVTSLQHARGWSHEETKNGLNANKMTDIVNDVFRCTYATIDVYTNTNEMLVRNRAIKKLLDMIIQWHHHTDNIDATWWIKTKVKITHLNYITYLCERFITRLGFSNLKPWKNIVVLVITTGLMFDGVSDPVIWIHPFSTVM